MRTLVLCLAQLIATDCASATLSVPQTVEQLLPTATGRAVWPDGKVLPGAATPSAGLAANLITQLAKRSGAPPDRTPRLIRTLRAMRLGEGLPPETVILLSLIGASSTPAAGDRTAQAVVLSAGGQGDQAVALIGIGQQRQRRLAGAQLPDGLPGFIRIAYLRGHSLTAEPSRP